MKLNKWTVGLAAVGAISLSSAVQAEESQMNVVNAVTSGTTITQPADDVVTSSPSTAVSGRAGSDEIASTKASTSAGAAGTF